MSLIVAQAEPVTEIVAEPEAVAEIVVGAEAVAKIVAEAEMQDRASEVKENTVTCIGV